MISQDKPCPKYDKIFQEILNNPPPEIERVYQKHDELYAYLMEHSGLVSVLFLSVFLVIAQTTIWSHIISASIRTHHLSGSEAFCGTIYWCIKLINLNCQLGRILYSLIECVQSQNKDLHYAHTQNTCNWRKVLHWLRKSHIKCRNTKEAAHRERSIFILDMISRLLA